MNKKDYDLEYYRTRCTVFKLLLNNEKDKDVILFIRSLPNVNGYLKALIRADMEKREK
jgi:hypothetical protein